jgi:predicted ATPase
MPALTSLKVTDRCLQGEQFDLTSPGTGEPSPFVALVGANGTGKTTVLDFIARHAMDPFSGFSARLFSAWQRHPKEMQSSWLAFQHDVVLVSSDGWYVPEDTWRKSEAIRNRVITTTLYVRTGYLPVMPANQPLQHGPKQGMTPQLALQATTPGEIQQRINAVHQWWLHQHWEYPTTTNLDRLWEALAPFLPGRTYAGVNPEDHLPCFQVGDSRVSFNELSSGERRIVLLFMEIAMHCGEDGLLLFDEPEAHFHPSWQRLLPDALTRLIPRGQVIVATHSPFIVEGLPAHQVFAFGDTPW